MAWRKVHTAPAMGEEHSEAEARPLQSDEAFASDIHDFHSLLRTGDREGLISALESPDLFRHACDDPRYHAIAMQGIAVLAWARPAQASEHLVHFDAERSRQDPNSGARMAARSLIAALEWRQLEADPASPLSRAEILREFLRLYPALADDGAHASNLREDLQRRPEFYTELLQYLHTRAQVLPRWLFNFVDRRADAQPDYDEPGYAPLPELNASQHSALRSTITALRGELKGAMSRYLVWVVVVGLVIALPTALGALLGLLVLGASFALGEGKSYETIVRPRLIDLAIAHGVGAKQVVRSIYDVRSKAGKLGSFDIKIENDHTLDLLAALSLALSPPPPLSQASGPSEPAGATSP